MAKKAKAKVRNVSSRSRQQPHQNPLLVHARAISELAAAIRQHADAVATTTGAAAVASDDARTTTDVTLPPLSRGQILEGIKAVFNTDQVLKDDDEINTLFPGDPGKLVAMWEDFDDYPLFRKRGLAIGPNDLRFVKYVKELIGVIAWGLKKALN